MMTTRSVGVGGFGFQPPQQLHGWNHHELDGDRRLPQQLEGWMANE